MEAVTWVLMLCKGSCGVGVMETVLLLLGIYFARPLMIHISRGRQFKMTVIE